MNDLKNLLRWRLRTLIRAAHRCLPVRSRSETRNILCLVTGGIGDQLMAIPALRSLRNRYPDANMHVVWIGGELGFLQGEIGNAILENGKNSLGMTFRALKGWDLVYVNVQGVFSVFCEWLTMCSRAPRRIGPVYPDNTHGSVYSEPYPIRFDEHVTVTNCRAAGDAPSTQALPYPVASGRVAGSARAIRRVYLHPGTSPGYEAKQWPLAKYRLLAAELSLDPFFEPAILAGPGEYAQARRIAKGLSIPVLRPGSVKELFQTIARATVLVGNDSGPAHIAAALGIPIVVLFGPTNPARVAPVYEKGTIIRSSEACSPCFDRNTSCRKARSCLEDITVERVTKACRELVQSL